MDVEQIAFFFQEHWALIVVLIAVLGPIIWGITALVYGERIRALEERLRLSEDQRKTQPGTDTGDCIYTNFRVNGRPWPPPGEILTIEDPFVPIEWDAKPNCSATVQVYYDSQLTYTAQVYSPTTVKLDHGLGRYELKIWEHTAGRPPLRVMIVQLVHKRRYTGNQRSV